MSFHSFLARHSGTPELPDLRGDRRLYIVRVTGDDGQGGPGERYYRHYVSDPRVNSDWLREGVYDENSDVYDYRVLNYNGMSRWEYRSLQLSAVVSRTVMSVMMSNEQGLDDDREY